MAEGGSAPGSGPALRERRDPQHQAPDVAGARDTDPCLSTRDCATRLGVSPRFILGEIMDGRLPALALSRPGVRRLYRIRPVDLDAYLARYQWMPASSR